MDLIVLLNDKNTAELPHQLISAEGLEKIEAIAAWLTSNNTGATDVYIKMEVEWSTAQKIIDSVALWNNSRPFNLFFVVPLQFLQPALITYMDAHGFSNLVITCNNQNDDIDSATKIITGFQAAHPASKIHFSIWFENNNGRYAYRRLSKLKNLDIEVKDPLFGPAKTGRTPVHEGIPGQVKNASACCELFNETIVIDSDGQLLVCPSGVRGIGTGVNIFENSHEQLLLYKGMCSGLPGKTNTCVACDYNGRFQWEKRSGGQMEQLINKGKLISGETPWNLFKAESIHQCDASELDENAQTQYLQKFQQRLIQWAADDDKLADAKSSDLPSVSVEVPVFKGGWLIPCIESVLYQTSNRWVLYLVWDEGDALSRRILEIVHQLNHPKLKVFFCKNQGIARSRHFLSSMSSEDYIIPLDDDDMVGATIAEDLTKVAVLKPWASIIRARRRFIDENGNLLDMPEWFPFENRKYQDGMVTDLHNHCQPTLLSRKAYMATTGWEGFPDFYYAGEDCDIYLKLEEKGAIELYDKVLYYYRLNSKRTSHLLKPEGAYEMWRRLADKTIARIGLPLQRSNTQPPYIYAPRVRPAFTKDMVDFVVPFYEVDEKELPYSQRRPVAGLAPQHFELTGYNSFGQNFPVELYPCSRIELSFTAEQYAEGTLQIQITETGTDKIIAEGKAQWKGKQEISKSVSIQIEQGEESGAQAYTLSLTFIPARNNSSTIKVLFYELEEPILFGRIFSVEKGYSKSVLDRCLNSLRAIGIPDDAIYVVNQKRSSSVNRNYGYSLTKRPLICFMDDDAEITSEESLNSMLALMAESNAGLIGPRLVTNDNKIFCADPFFNEKQRPVPRGIGESDDGRYQYTSDVTWLPSTFLIVKREVMQAINGFDETYEGSQMEDVDLCLKARARNFKCIYAGNTSVLHHNNQRNDRFAENFARFALRWAPHKELFKQINS
jgi:glycosyltransferase involved in cell wall biosynthesis